MPGTAAQQNATPDSGAEVIQLDVAKAEGAVVQAAMTEVTSLIANIAKAAGVEAPVAADPEPTEDVAKAAGMKARKLHEAALKSAGLKDDALKTAMATFDKALDAGPPQSNAKPPVGKNADADTKKALDAEPAAVAPTIDETVAATLETIAKAKSFTPGRVAQLAKAMEALQKLLMDVIPTGSSPSSTVPAVSTHSNPNTTRTALVGKSEEMGALLQGLDAVVAKMEAIANPKAAEPEVTTTKSAEPGVEAALASIMKRLDGIESAAPASQSGGGEGDKPETTVDTQKSFWNGLL